MELIRQLSESCLLLGDLVFVPSANLPRVPNEKRGGFSSWRWGLSGVKLPSSRLAGGQTAAATTRRREGDERNRTAPPQCQPYHQARSCDMRFIAEPFELRRDTSSSRTSGAITGTVRPLRTRRR